MISKCFIWESYIFDLLKAKNKRTLIEERLKLKCKQSFNNKPAVLWRGFIGFCLNKKIEKYF